MFTLEKKLLEVLDDVKKYVKFDSQRRIVLTSIGSEINQTDVGPKLNCDFIVAGLSDKLWGHSILFNVTSSSLTDLVLDMANINGNQVALDARCQLCAGQGAIYRASDAILAMLYENGKMKRKEIADANEANATGSGCTTKKALDQMVKAGLIVSTTKGRTNMLYSLTDLGSEVAMEAEIASHSFRDCNESWWFDDDGYGDLDSYSISDVATHFDCPLPALRGVALTALKFRDEMLKTKDNAAA